MERKPYQKHQLKTDTWNVLSCGHFQQWLSNSVLLGLFRVAAFPLPLKKKCTQFALWWPNKLETRNCTVGELGRRLCSCWGKSMHASF